MHIHDPILRYRLVDRVENLQHARLGWNAQIFDGALEEFDRVLVTVLVPLETGVGVLLVGAESVCRSGEIDEGLDAGADEGGGRRGSCLDIASPD